MTRLVETPHVCTAAPATMHHAMKVRAAMRPAMNAQVTSVHVSTDPVLNAQSAQCAQSGQNVPIAHTQKRARRAPNGNATVISLVTKDHAAISPATMGPVMTDLAQQMALVSHMRPPITTSHVQVAPTALVENRKLVQAVASATGTAKSRQSF